MSDTPLQRLHLLTLKIARTHDGVRATFGGRGMTPDDLGAMTRAIAAEMLATLPSYCAPAPPSARTTCSAGDQA